MRSLHRSVVVGMGLGLVVLVTGGLTPRRSPALGPESKPDRDEEFSESIKLSPNRKAKKSLEAAQDFIQEGAWLEATHVLQGLLDVKEDAFVQVRRPGPDGKEAVCWASVRSEANRLLGTLPRPGREVYELQYGGKARQLLAEAKKKSDPQLLAEVGLRYLHTKAGAEATELLGTYHLDRGRPVMAVLCFERLLLHEATAAGLKPLTLLKAALAFHRAGDKSRFATAWQRLAKASPAGVRLGNREVPLAALQKELDRLPAATVAADADEWTMFQGSPCRSAHARGGIPFLDEDMNKWQQPTVRHADARRWLADAVAYQEARQQSAALPAFFPVAARGKLVFRTHYGVVAADLKTGQVAWQHESDWSVDRMAADSGKAAALNQWIPLYLQGGTANILFENSTLGSLCTDGRRVYAVEDLAIPPHPQFLQQNAWGGRHRAFLGPFEEAVNQNQLKALDLDTGGVAWAAGGRGGKGELHDCFFLGPPLPLGGKLYVLVEKNSEILLYCLDADSGMACWKQPLATVRDRLPLDVGRRVHAVHLAYGDGVLVCPTNAGAILGVDLLTHSLVWAKPYREAAQAPEPQIHPGRRFRYYRFGHSLKPDWKDAAPVVQDGKVVFTAPDGVAVECLDLRDGSTVWKAPRADDLYLAGVYRGKVLLVGRRQCRALGLADGKQLWARETGVPSGHGVAGDKVYYLPLKSAGAGKAPGVCALDIDTGTVVARARTRNGEVPGNLVFHDGKVISQTITQVAAYPQLDVKLAEMNARIAKDPRDPVGLAERGGLRFSEGDVAAAVADLRAALAGKLAEPLRAKVRGKLFEALSELLEKDFAAAEKHLDEYREMCRVAVPETASAEERQRAEREQRRRRSRYLSLLARGRAAQGRLADALQAFREFGTLARDGDLIALPGDPAARARPYAWARGCIAALFDAAKPEQRQALEAAARKEWQAVAGSKDVDRLRQFAAVFDARLPEGREARLLLAEQLADEGPSVPTFLEAELLLLQVLRAGDDPPAARAAELLAKLAERKGLTDDSAYWSRKHSAGETEASAWGNGTLRARETFSAYQAAQPFVYLEPRGPVTPFFERHRLGLNVGGAELKLVDTFRNVALASQNLTRSQVHFGYYGSNQPRQAFYPAGHVAVFQFGHLVYAYDPLERKLLWDRSLVSSRMPSAYQIVPSGDGGYQAFYPDGRVQHIGRIGAVTAAYVCLLTPDGLVALDPLKGTPLWTRSDVPAQSQVFGDERHVFAVPVRPDGGHGKALAFRACDGAAVAVPDFAALFGRKVRAAGRRLLLNDTAPQTGNLTVRLYDALTGKDVWRQEFSARSLFLHDDDADVVGVVEPARDGKVTLLDLRTGRTVLTTAVDPKDLAKAEDVHLLQDRERFYLAVSNPAGGADNAGRGPMSNVIGARTVLVNGKLYAFDRATGARQWAADVPHQLLVLEHFKELPFLLGTARYVRRDGFQQRQVVLTKVLDKRTGQVVHDRTTGGAAPFYALNLNLPERKVDLVGYNQKIEFWVEGGDGRLRPQSGPRP